MTDVASTATPSPTVASSGPIPKEALIALGFGMLITSIGNNFLITVMPPLARDMGMVEWQLGALLGLSGLFMLFTGPLWGRASEDWGRKPILLMGGIGYVITNTAFGFIIDARLAGAVGVIAAFALMAGTRSVYSLTSGAVYPATVAMIADLTPRDKRASGVALIGATWGLGSVVGPVLAAAFSGFGPTAPIYVVSVLAAISVVLYAAILKEPQRHETQETPSFRKVLNAQTLSIVSAFGLLIMGNVGLMVCLGFHFQDVFKLDTAGTTRAVGYALTSQAIAQIFVQVVFIRRVRWAPKAMIMFGMPIVAIASLIVLYTENYWLAVAAMALMGFGGGFGWPAFMTASSLSAGPENQGSVAGLTMSFQALGFVIGPLIGTITYASHPSWPFFIQIGVVAVLLVIVNVIKMPRV